MMVVPRGVREGSLGAFRRFEGSLGVFCRHAGGVWPPSDDVLTMHFCGLKRKFKSVFLFSWKSITFDAGLLN
jgi:hypothetical protein